jgi:hypothetical protein
LLASTVVACTLLLPTAVEAAATSDIDKCDSGSVNAPLGDKAIVIAPDGSRRKSDVIVAIQFRRYYKFISASDQSYTEGMCFSHKAGERIANFPKLHAANLTTKHQTSNSRLKPMIRVLKNVRSRCVDDGLLKAGRAPSYFIEGLLYNVPPSKFANTYQDSFINVFKWIQNEVDKSQLLCANEQYYLLRDGAHTCWPKADGDAYINCAIKLWNEW